MTVLSTINKLFRLVGFICTAFVLFVAGCIALIQLDSYLTFGTEKFSRDAWLKARTPMEKNTCYRGAMAHDIQENVLKKGMTRDEVVAVLGAPDGKNDGYWLGMCGTMDGYALELHFEPDGRFRSSYVRLQL